jgi:hypothetical protein
LSVSLCVFKVPLSMKVIFLPSAFHTSPLNTVVIVLILTISSSVF